MTRKNLSVLLLVLLLLPFAPARAGDFWNQVRDQFTLGGELVGYAQGSAAAEIGKDSWGADQIAGFSARLNLAWKPTDADRVDAGLRYTANGELKPDSSLTSSVNEINASLKDRDNLLLENLTYTHTFFGGVAFAAIGKADPETYLDQNAYANSCTTQFVGQALGDNPILDMEDEHAPLAAIGIRPAKGWEISAVASSTSHGWAGSPEPKNVWDDVFDGPFLGLQATWSPAFGNLSGNYRAYGWSASYEHLRLDPRDPGTEDGWGLGVSFDQEVSSHAGLFLRAGYQNEAVYEIPWFASLGASLTGLIPTRDKDVLGLGSAVSFANDETPGDDPEILLEAYYRVIFTPHFSATPDVQYVINPGQDSSNDGLFVWMLRVEAVF